MVWGKWDRSKLIIQKRKWGGGHLQVIINEKQENEKECALKIYENRLRIGMKLKMTKEDMVKVERDITVTTDKI